MRISHAITILTVVSLTGLVVYPQKRNLVSASRTKPARPQKSGEVGGQRR